MVECLRTAITDTGTHSHPGTVMDFIGQTLALMPVLDEARRSDDENTASLIYALYTAMVESHSRLLLKSALEEERRGVVVQVSRFSSNQGPIQKLSPYQKTIRGFSKG